MTTPVFPVLSDQDFYEVLSGKSGVSIIFFTQEYAIFHLPAFFIFVDGVYHAPLQCEARVPVLHSTIATLIAAPAMEAP